MKKISSTLIMAFVLAVSGTSLVQASSKASSTPDSSSNASIGSGNAFANQLVCSLKAETGPCKAAFRRWTYAGGKCGQFIYGGCGGNGNNFKTQQECEQTCRPEKIK